MSFERSLQAETDLAAALSLPLTTNRRALGAAALSVVTYIGLVLTSFLEYSTQMISADPGRRDDTPLVLTALRMRQSGGLRLIVLYAIVPTNVFGRLQQIGRSRARRLSSAILERLASSYASYDVRIFWLLESTDVLTILSIYVNSICGHVSQLHLGYYTQTGGPRPSTITPNTEGDT